MTFNVLRCSVRLGYELFSPNQQRGSTRLNSRLSCVLAGSRRDLAYRAPAFENKPGPGLWMNATQVWAVATVYSRSAEEGCAARGISRASRRFIRRLKEPNEEIGSPRL